MGADTECYVSVSVLFCKRGYVGLHDFVVCTSRFVAAFNSSGSLVHKLLLFTLLH